MLDDPQRVPDDRVRIYFGSSRESLRVDLGVGAVQVLVRRVSVPQADVPVHWIGLGEVKAPSSPVVEETDAFG